MHVVCVGLATVDLVQRVERLPGVDAKAEALTADVAAGGPATNAAITAAALGATVTLVTAVGAHPLGGLIRADTARHGVTLLDAAPDDPTPPPVSAVTVLDATGQRTIVSRNARGTTVAVPPGLAAVLSTADVVLADGHHRSWPGRPPVTGRCCWTRAAGGRSSRSCCRAPTWSCARPPSAHRAPLTSAPHCRPPGCGAAPSPADRNRSAGGTAIAPAS